jgi:[acyl-carrier-protein] S-malonyltransferase
MPVADPLTAWVFPGQGSQETGMGRDLYEASRAARELYDRADDVLGRPLSSLCFEGPASELGQTVNAQPAIFVTSMACLAAAREAGALPGPAFVAGHSMGEYTALTAASAVAFDDGLRLVDTRGRLTQAAANATSGRMAALIGLDEDAAQTVCDDSGVELCNLNAPGQIVLGGHTEAVERACALALERGARRAIPLDVSGAFHTSLMEAAVDPFRQAVSSTAISSPRPPLVANRTAAAMTDPAEIADELVHQLTHPVRWVECVEFLAAEGVTNVIEIGPGKVLTGLVKRITPDLTLRNINGMASLAT